MHSSVPALSLTEIELAVTSDGGGSWELASRVSAARPATITCPKKFNPTGTAGRLRARAQCVEGRVCSEGVCVQTDAVVDGCSQVSHPSHGGNRKFV